MFARFSEGLPRNHDLVDHAAAIGLPLDLKLTLGRIRWILVFRRIFPLASFGPVSSCRCASRWLPLGHGERKSVELVVSPAGACAAVAEEVEGEEEAVTVPVLEFFVERLHAVIVDIECEVESNVRPGGEQDEREISRPAPGGAVFCASLDRMKVAGAFQRPGGRGIPSFFQRAIDNRRNLEPRDPPFWILDLPEFFADSLEAVEKVASALEVLFPRLSSAVMR